MSVQSREASHYLEAAEQAVRTTAGVAALDALGWWDLLAELEDPAMRAAMFSLFRAQGRGLGSSPALGALLAQPYLSSTDLTPGSVVATVTHPSAEREVQIVVGDIGDRHLLVDVPGKGAAVVEAEHLVLRPVAVPGRLALYEVNADLGRATLWIHEQQASTARVRSAYLGRVAIALEILGAAESVVALAIDYAGQREQFAKPIGTFQAIRHILSWASTDCVALENVAQQAVALAAAPPARYDEVAKALAGRNGRRACERALQVFGGIGFTAEHEHHHFHGRVLALDTFLGTSADLTHELGSWQRTERVDPGYPAAVLLPNAL